MKKIELYDKEYKTNVFRQSSRMKENGRGSVQRRDPRI